MTLTITTAHLDAVLDSIKEAQSNRELWEGHELPEYDKTAIRIRLLGEVYFAIRQQLDTGE